MHCDCIFLKVLEHIHINYFKILVCKGYVRIDCCWLLFVLIRSLRNYSRMYDNSYGCPAFTWQLFLFRTVSVGCLSFWVFWSSLFICYLSYCELTWGNGLKHEFSASSLSEISVFYKANALESLALFLIADNLLNIL